MRVVAGTAGGRRLTAPPSGAMRPTSDLVREAVFNALHSRSAVVGAVVLGPGERTLIPTGFAIALPPGFEAQVRPRSGLALKHGITLPNAPGTIDADYRGEVGVILANRGTEDFTVTRGMRIAQMVVAAVSSVRWREVDDLAPSSRGDSGFGSTGMSSENGE